MTKNINSESNAPKTISEFCNKWRICRQTVDAEERRGHLDITRIGRAKRITASQEARWVERCSERGVTALQAIRGAK